MKNINLDLFTFDELKLFYSANKIENSWLEYKRELNFSTKEEKKEFLADIASFANSNGGYLIFGIDENEGIVGFDSKSVDNTILAIEESIRNNIEPRINLKFKHIELIDGKIVLVIFINRSWNKPHQIKVGSYRRFIARGNNGKFELDIDQIRTSFIGTDSLQLKLKDFLTNRISNLIGNDTPIILKNQAKLALQIIPTQNFLSNNIIDLIPLYHKYYDYHPMGSSGSFEKLFNFDGLLAYHQTESYVQIYRSGIIESVACCFFPEDDMIIPSSILVYDFFTSFNKHLDFYEKQNIKYPLVLKLSMLNIDGYKFATDGFSGRTKQIKNKDLIFSSIVIDSKENAFKNIKPWFDQLWQAFGHLKCSFYNEEGELTFKVN